MKGAAELVAAAHVADRREVGLDHAGQLGAWARLGDDAHSDQSIQSILHDGGGDHVDSCHGTTFMLTVCDSDVGSTPNCNTHSISSCPSRDKRPMALSAKCATGTISFVLLSSYRDGATPVHGDTTRYVHMNINMTVQVI